ncbi:DnaJ-domain-containing protein [Marasmius fiardii PR-910]|nr:DnaJ-domain-containing protein [Marasmius fiardii PR-910]
MKIPTIFALIALLVTVVLAWEQEDHEIFDLVSAVERSEGKGTSFYSWLEVPHTASTAEIAKAYRKLSMQLHPDKNPGKKNVHERFARLGVVAAILRNSESRERYDFFYKNGVPTWRGTGYYYSRFRPGLGTVAVFLIMLTSSLQYMVQRMNYKRDLERIEYVIREARLAAWGTKMTPVEGQRKVKVNLGGPERYDEDGYRVPGRMIDMVVSGDAVYILDESGDMHPVDSSTAIPPAPSRTWFITLVLSLVGSLASKFKKGDNPDPVAISESEYEEGYDSSAASDSPGSGTITPNGNSTKQATVKAGGRRRKAVKRR